MGSRISHHRITLELRDDRLLIHNNGHTSEYQVDKKIIYLDHHICIFEDGRVIADLGRHLKREDVEKICKEMNVDIKNIVNAREISNY